MHVRCECLKLFLFLTASELVTEHDIYDEPWVRTIFWYHNPVILRCTIVGRAIGEQRDYAARISFGLVAHHKSMLCRSLLGRFRTSFPIDMCRARISIDVWYLWCILIEWICILPLQWLIRAVGGCMVVGRKVGLTQLNGWTRLKILLIVHFLDDSMRVWSAHAVDVEMLSVRTRGRWQCTFANLVLCQAMMWTHLTETIHQRTTSVIKDEDDRSGDDRMDEMLDAIRPEIEINREDPPTPEV
jgi:hypothetical protein